MFQAKLNLSQFHRFGQYLVGKVMNARERLKPVHYIVIRVTNGVKFHCWLDIIIKTINEEVVIVYRHSDGKRFMTISSLFY